MADLIEIDIRTNIDEIARNLSSFAYKQVPFASARAATLLAQDIRSAERERWEAILNNPRAFTLNAVGVISARKDTLTATVFVKDRQAEYLLPEEVQGRQFLGTGRRIRTPVDIATNDSGDIPKGKIKQLVARPDTFMGVVHGINGIWQRPTAVRPGKRRASGKRASKLNTTGRMKLLVAFTRPVQVKTRLEYAKTAEAVVAKNFKRRFGEALAYAMATAR